MSRRAEGSVEESSRSSERGLIKLQKERHEILKEQALRERERVKGD
jgi:hypothetical protein